MRILKWKRTIKTKANEFKGDYNERKSKVKSLPGADSPTELEAKAAKIQKDYLDGKGKNDDYEQTTY